MARIAIFCIAAFLPFVIFGVSKVERKVAPNILSAKTVNQVLPEAKASGSTEPKVYKEPTGVPILMYHHVGDYPADADGTRKDLTVSTQNFTEQVEWLKSKGYTSVSMKQLYDSTQGSFTLPSKPIVFSFDDGYDDVFQNAVPVLLKNGYTGSFAIITSFVGTQNGTNIYASWEEISRAQKQGMEIVSHTEDHFDGSNVKKYNSEYVLTDLEGSKKVLADHSIDTNILVYPYGHYTLDYIDQAKKAGFVMAFTVAYGRLNSLTDLMRVPRVRVHGQENMERFEEILMGHLHPSATSATRQSSPKSL